MDQAGATYRPIDDYAIIGNCRSAALVSRNGSIDWLCWPRFDSPAIFCALLDVDRGGSFAIAPVDVRDMRRRYLGDTAVLETTFETPDGSFVLTDCMAITSPPERRVALTPEHEIVRRLRCTSGGGDVDIRFMPTSGFAQDNDPLVDRGSLGIRVETAHGLMTLHADRAMEVAADRRSASARATMRAGETINLSLTWTVEGPAVLAPVGDATRRTIDRTVASRRGTHGPPARLTTDRLAMPWSEARSSYGS